jgi:hypothetical protein
MDRPSEREKVEERVLLFVGQLVQNAILMVKTSNKRTG